MDDTDGDWMWEMVKRDAGSSDLAWTGSFLVLFPDPVTC